MRYHYTTQGTCSKSIEFDIDEAGHIHNVVFEGGCSGNTQGVSRLCEGMDAEKVIAILKGTSCKGGPTSCPDQLATAIMQALSSK